MLKRSGKFGLGCLVWIALSFVVTLLAWGFVLKTLNDLPAAPN